MKYIPNPVPVEAFVLGREMFPEWFEKLVEHKTILVFRLEGQHFVDYITHCLVREPNGSYLHIPRHSYVVYSETTGKVTGMLQFQFELLYTPAPEHRVEL